MSRAGYVLVGGRSSRMGTDKAFLRREENGSGDALAQHVAKAAAEAVNTVSLVGDPDVYACLGYRVIPDLRTGCGPLAGMEAALLDSEAEWTLITACDMAGVRSDTLRAMLQHARQLGPEIDALVPTTREGNWQPLCAVYRRRCAAQFSVALDQKVRKVTEVVTQLRVCAWPAADEAFFQNLNTPLDWEQYLNGQNA